MMHLTPRSLPPMLLLLLVACAQPLPSVTAPTQAPTGSESTATGSSTARINSVSGIASIGRYEKLELTVDLSAAYENPFDPAQIDVQGSFTGPDGKVLTVPGFFWQDFESVLSGGKEVLSARGKPAWKVRFTPPEVGRWTYAVSVRTPAGTATSEQASLEVTPSRRHGFARVDRRDPAYFSFDDGTPYVAIGQNVSWYGPGGTHDYEQWFGKMQAQGANFARIWMASWALGIEWSDTGLGDYTNRLDRAWQLDRVFALAEQHEIYLMLSLLNHGAFSTTTNPEWDKNPYNAALGGPCATPGEFATNPEARELFKRRLRYIAARWGYSPQLLAWEWWNEVDWTPLADRATLELWIKEMSGFLATVDPYAHLRTTSYGHTPEDAVFDLAEIDIVQRHVYETRDPAQSFPQAMTQMRRIKKPALHAEFGTGASGADSAMDREGVHIHNGLWAGIMTKGSGTGMTWWWDNYVDPLNLYGLFAGPATFMKGEDPAAVSYRPEAVRVTNGRADALLLRSESRALGWIKNRDFTYDALRLQYTGAQRRAQEAQRELTDFTPTYTAITGATLKIAGLASGGYRVEWWDTRGKGVLHEETLEVTDDGLELRIPSFERDLAFKVLPRR